MKSRLLQTAACCLWCLVAMVVPQTVGAREVDSAFGKTHIEGTPERVVTLYQGATDTAVALGIRPVGVVDSWVEKPMYRYLRAALKGVDHVGSETQPNLEEIAWLHPDLIVATSYRNQQTRGLLKDIAPTVAARSVFNFKATLRLMGKATGREERADRLLNEWADRVADFRRRVRQRLGNKWPQEVAIVRFKSHEARIYYSGFAGSILKQLGFRRPENQRGNSWGVKLTSQESIPAMNADVIFVFMNEKDPSVMENYHRWTANPLWQTLDAVKHDRVYRVDPIIWSMGGGIIAANALLDDVYAHYGLPQTRTRSYGRPGNASSSRPHRSGPVGHDSRPNTE